VILTALILFREINTPSGTMHSVLMLRGTRGAVGWGTALQAGGSRIHWNFSLTSSFRPGVDSVCNRNEYQEYFRGVKAALPHYLPLSCADCREIWAPQPPGILRICPGLCRDCFTLP